MFEHPAEEFLHEQGLITRRSAQRRALLGCIGCRWLKAAEQGKDAKFYGLEIAQCTGINRQTVYVNLDALAESEVIVGKQEDIDPSVEGRPQRTYYYPADSELGEAFRNTLEIPQECSYIPRPTPQAFH